MASRVAVMNRGRLVQTGTSAEIYERPASRFVADFVGEVNLFEGRLIAAFNRLALVVAGCEEPLPLPPGTILPDGAAVALALRPEKLVLSHTRPARFAIAATVSSVGYLGGVSIVHLVSAHGSLKAFVPSAAACGFARGTAVWASWSPEHGVVVAQ
jgi:putrescine transport system ATP-binding protein